MIASFVVAAVIVAIDQLTKHFFYGITKSIIGDFLWFKEVFNRGAAFGMMQGGTILFIVITIPVVALMIYIICSKKYLNKYNKLCVGIILGGAIGNFIDRVALNGVRDFIDFRFINFPTFNFADAAITIGVIMLIIGLIVELVKSKKQKTAPAAEETKEEK